MGKAKGEWSGKPLGDAEMSGAISRVNKKMKQMMHAWHTYEYDVDGTLQQMFSHEHIRISQLARGVVKEPYMDVDYVLSPEVSIEIGYEYSKSLPIRKMLSGGVAPDSPLMTYIKAVQEIYHKFEQVKGVLRWLNKNASAGAIRYYWPCIQQVAPHSAVGQMPHPTRYLTPENIEDWFPAMRATTETMAMAALIPEDAVHTKDNRGLELTFNATLLHCAGLSAATTPTFMSDAFILKF